MFYANLTNAQNSNAVLASETFYNNDTKVVHVLRNLGNWSFFASHRGTPYREYAQYFRNVLLFPSFFIPVTVWVYSFFFVIRKKSEYRRYLLLAILLIGTYAFIGGLYSDWVTANFFKWFFANVPFAQIFRNTYKWTSAAVLLSSVMLSSFSNSLKIKLGQQRYNVFVVTSILLTVLSVLPMFGGMSFDKKSIINQIPSYWSVMANRIDQGADIINSRVLLLPSQYFTVFKWDDEFKALPGNIANSLVHTPSVYNTCIGCGIDVSLEWINFLYKNIGSGKVDALLSISGVTHILQRNDFFLGYYDSQSPQAIKRLLSKYTSIKNESTIGELDLYSVQKISRLIYSPKKVLSINQVPDILDYLNFSNFDSQDSFLTLNQNKDFTRINESSTYFDKVFENGEMYVSSNATSVVYGAFEAPYESNYRIVNKATSTSIINGNDFVLRNEIFNEVGRLSASTTIALQPGKYFIEGQVISGKTVYQESFESPTSTWLAVRDCAKNKPNAKLSVKYANRYISGSALEVGSDENMACVVSRRFQVKPSSYYVLTLDTANVTGNDYGFCLWNGVKCIAREISQSPNGDSWITRRHVFKTDPSTKTLSIYLYSPSQKIPTTVQYDNVSISEITNILGDYAIESQPKANFQVAHISNVEAVGNAKYRFKAESKGNFIVIFRESYHPKWVLRTNGSSEPKWQLPNFINNKVNPISVHQVLNGFSNAWYVDTEQLCAKQEKCTKNPDGSYDIEMTIEFWPQRWFYLGLLISGTTFAGCIGYLVFDGVRILRRKRTAKQTPV